MQTAVVDYIFEQLEENSLFFRGTDNELNISISASDYLDLKRLAKEMEKQQITDAYSAGENNIDNDGCSISRNGAENYYNDTFKKD